MSCQVRDYRTPGTESLHHRCMDTNLSLRSRVMSPLPNFPTIQLVQIVRCMIVRDPSGVLIARSPDVPGRAAFASDIPSLEVEIRDLIEGYFARQGDAVRAYRSRGRKRGDLSTWEVETIGDDAELLMAAE
jgi:hypothetical protein